MDYLVFTDLDGTLLDHHSYSYAEALPAIQLLREKSCPLIFNSSKTASEISQLRHELRNVHPFIVENGSAVYIPDGYFDGPGRARQSAAEGLSVHSFGPDYRQLLETLHGLRRQRGYSFTGFSDLTADEIAERTGLSREEAVMASDRAASEPLSWHGTEARLADFKADLAAKGLTLTRGGRFYHVMGRTDKASALLWLARKYRSAWPDRAWTSVALGDGPNDRAMLEAADIAVVIKAASGTSLALHRSKQTLCPDAPGPRGWQVAIDTIIRQSSNQGA